MQSNLKIVPNDNKNKIIEVINDVLLKLNASDDFILKSIQEVEDKPESEIYSFENEFVTFDLGEEINSQVTSSKLVLRFNTSILYKIFVVLRLEDDKSSIILVYNTDLEFVDYELKNDVIAGYRVYDKFCDPSVERNKVLVHELKRLSEPFTTDKEVMDDIFEQILSTNLDYSKVASTNNRYYFKIVYGGGSFNITTNLISTGVGHLSSMGFEEECRIKFNDFHNIVDVEFNSINKRIALINRERYIFTFDNQLKLIKYEKRYIKNNKICNEVVLDIGLPFKEYVFILNLKISHNEYIDELLPEFSTPSAYNFNSQSYKDRVNTVEMLLF